MAAKKPYLVKYRSDRGNSGEDASNAMCMSITEENKMRVKNTND